MPEEVEFDPDGRGLECEVRGRGGRDDALKVTLKDEDTRAVFRTTGGKDAAVRFAYEDGSLSSTVSSSGTAARGDRKAGNPADRIQEQVRGIIERAMP